VAKSSSPPVWEQAEDAVVRGDADALGAILREHGETFRKGRVRTRWWGGLSPSYLEADPRAIIAREHDFESWESYAAFAAARADTGSPTARFEAAVDAIVDGDVATLDRLLGEDPELVRHRSARRHRSLLLHYVGANGVEGFRQRTPPNIVRIAERLLDAGSDIDATAGMYGGDSRTLMLAATSIHPVTAGVQNDLMAFLLARGASVGEATGDAAWSKLINDCHANGRPGAAEFLAERAGSLDLEAAAGVGQFDVVASFFDADGRLKPTATPEQLRDGFTWACEYGRAAVVAFLLRHGADAVAKLPKHHGQTGLHWAAWGAHNDTVGVLLEAGAPVDTKDDRYRGTALGWALHAWGGGGKHPGDRRYVEVVRQLVAAGSTVDREWLELDTPESPVAEALRRTPEMREALALTDP
jgi:hypothetical protein